MPRSQKFKLYLILLLVIIVAIVLIATKPDQKPKEDEVILTAIVQKRSYPIEIRSVGELEASRSTNIACTLRLDQPKIIDLVADGIYVTKGDLLARIDPSPYEKRIDELKHADCRMRKPDPGQCACTGVGDKTRQNMN